MPLIAIASDKGAPGVTTAALALAAVWPRPVLLAECDPAGGDLAYRFPSAGGGHLDPRRGVLSLAVAARRGMQPNQVWEHVQKLHGGLDVLAGVTNAEQGAGLNLLWGQIGKVLATLPQADVIADCGRLGSDGPVYDLLAEATTVVLVTKASVGDVIRLRDRVTAFAAAAESRGRRGFGAAVVVVADQRSSRGAFAEVEHVLRQAKAPAAVIGGLAHDPKGAALFNGGMAGKLEKTQLIKSARNIAQQLVHSLPPATGQPAPGQPVPGQPVPGQPVPGRPAAQATLGQPASQAAAAPGRHQAQGGAQGQGGAQAQAQAQGGAYGATGTGPQAQVPQTQMQPVTFPRPPSAARHAQPPVLPAELGGLAEQTEQTELGGQARLGETVQGDWAGSERQKWRERERQESGGA